MQKSTDTADETNRYPWKLFLLAMPTQVIPLVLPRILASHNSDSVSPSIIELPYSEFKACGVHGIISNEVKLTYRKQILYAASICRQTSVKPGMFMDYPTPTLLYCFKPSIRSRTSTIHISRRSSSKLCLAVQILTQRTCFELEDNCGLRTRF